MRRVSLILIACASGALAAPAPKGPPATWADWVGEWQGKLRWSSCTADGAQSATLALDADDGAVAIDLEPAGAGLAAMPLVEDDAGWLGQRSDVTVHVSRPHGDAIELAIELESGCRVDATLRRAGSGIAECDRLAAWARIEARCSKLARPPLEDAARLARQKATWLRATSSARVTLGAQCTARAAKVEAELVDVGCAPNPDPLIGMRGAECHALRQATQKLARCAAIPADWAAIISQEAFALVGAAQTADAASLPVVESECHRVRDKLAQTVQRAGCPF